MVHFNYNNLVEELRDRRSSAHNSRLVWVSGIVLRCYGRQRRRVGFQPAHWLGVTEKSERPERFYEPTRGEPRRSTSGRAPGCVPSAHREAVEQVRTAKIWTAKVSFAQVGSVQVRFAQIRIA